MTHLLTIWQCIPVKMQCEVELAFQSRIEPAGSSVIEYLNCNIMRKSVDGVVFCQDAMQKVKDLENLCLKQALRLKS
ncbi:hypothetical protein E3N88_11837 [Mikania micrantha]|uniref:Uncharacterized protein n=1 Tax=Mikania micrantha TaxID=192012 RepID=A0A5N6P575_9ASTR|nr:hypothetical protein E3N88_11837 [Mikania micrantha]